MFDPGRHNRFYCPEYIYLVYRDCLPVNYHSIITDNIIILLQAKVIGKKENTEQIQWVPLWLKC